MSINRTVALDLNSTLAPVVLLDGTQVPGYYALRMRIQTKLADLPMDGVRRPMFKTTLPGADAFFRVTINSLQYVTTGSVFGHQSIENFNINFGAVTKYRVNALGALLSNLTPAITAGGMIAMRQIPSTEPWWELLPGDPYKNVAKGSSHWSGKLENGAYCFYKPSDILDFAMRDDFRVDEGIIYDVHAPLTSSDYLAVAIDASSINFGSTFGTPPSNSINFRLLAYHGIEYQTDDTWREARVTTISKIELDRAIDALIEVKQFAENPTHWKTIWQGIKNGIKAVPSMIEKYAPVAGSIAKLLSSVL